MQKEQMEKQKIIGEDQKMEELDKKQVQEGKEGQQVQVPKREGEV